MKHLFWCSLCSMHIANVIVFTWKINVRSWTFENPLRDKTSSLKATKYYSSNNNVPFLARDMLESCFLFLHQSSHSSLLSVLLLLGVFASSLIFRLNLLPPSQHVTLRLGGMETNRLSIYLHIKEKRASSAAKPRRTDDFLKWKKKKEESPRTHAL